jgi:hypothetical protein
MRSGLGVRKDTETGGSEIVKQQPNRTKQSDLTVETDHPKRAKQRRFEIERQEQEAKRQ